MRETGADSQKRDCQKHEKASVQMNGINISSSSVKSEQELELLGLHDSVATENDEKTRIQPNGISKSTNSLKNEQEIVLLHGSIAAENEENSSIQPNGISNSSNSVQNEQKIALLHDSISPENDEKDGNDILSNEFQDNKTVSDTTVDAITGNTKANTNTKAGNTKLDTSTNAENTKSDTEAASTDKRTEKDTKGQTDVKEKTEKDAEAKEEDKPPPPKEPWRLVPFILISYMLLNIVVMSFSVLYVDLARYYDVSMGTAGWIASVQFFSRTAGGLMTGAIIAKRGCRLVACMGSIIVFLSLILSAFSPNLWVLMLSYGLTCGFGTSMLIGSCMVIVQQRFHANRTLASSICMSGLGLGGALGPIWFDFLIREFGWRGAFIVHAGVSLHSFAFGLFFRSPPDLLTKKESVLKNALDFSLLWKNRVFALFCLCQLLYTFNVSAFGRHITSRAIFMGCPRTEAALLTTCLGGTVAFGRLSLGFVTNLKRLDKMVTLSLALIGGGVMSGLGTWFVASSFGGSAAVVIGFAVFQSVCIPLVQVVITKIETIKNFPKANSLVLVTQSLPSLISTPLAGWMFDTTGNYNLPFLINGTVQIISGCVCMATVPLHRRRRRMLLAQEEKENMDCTSV